MCLSVAKYTEQCEWVGPLYNNRLGAYQIVVAGETPEDCKSECENATTINCVSFDYNLAQKKCYLSLNDRTDKKLIEGAGWDFYERICDSKL
jgi:hypothetical protein